MSARTESGAEVALASALVIATSSPVSQAGVVLDGTMRGAGAPGLL